MDGNLILTDLLDNSTFGSKEQAIASLAIFSNPKTIDCLKNRNVFKIVRSYQNRGKFTTDFLYDNNISVQDIFCWSNNVKKKAFNDVQFNHIYRNPKRVETYTCLSNIVVTPAFLAKLTDSDSNIIQLLKYRVFDIYGFNPDQIEFEKPEGYDNLIWREFLPINENLHDHLIKVARKNSKNNAMKSMRQFGWAFNDFQPLLEI